MNPPSRRVEWQAGFWFLLNGLAMVVVGAMVPTLFSAVVFAVGTMHGCSRIERLSAAGWGHRAAGVETILTGTTDEREPC